jgi:alpha-L-rhamnosidase
MKLRPALCFLTLLATGTMTFGSMAAPFDLRTEYASNPIGLDTLQPRFSWKLTSMERGARQSAYQILVASSDAKAMSGEADLWDSGRVTSAQSIQIVYAGKPLGSRQRCTWRVRVWDSQGNPTEFSGSATWEMGLLTPQDWKADWLGYPAGWNGRALYFRRDFDLEKDVAFARLYAAGLGYHELHLNGIKVGDHFLDPGLTDYGKRVPYAAHDVTPLVRRGRNTLGAIVGNGWYGMPKLLLQLEVTFTDGTRMIVPTHPMQMDEAERWWVTSGPIVRNSVFDGESYDARLEKPDWDVPTPTPHRNPADRREAWAIGMPVDPPPGRLVAQYQEPVRVIEKLPCTSIREPKPGVWVFDAGQNVAGFVELRVTAPRDTSIVLRYAESLETDGTVNQSNLRSADCIDTYVCKGGAEESWHPVFTYHGFRYVQVEGFPGKPGLDVLTVLRLRSAVEPNGTFECSSELLNRIQRMIANTEANNLCSVPTDCPQRNERMGWMNDLTVRLEESLYNFELSRFYTKFLDDVADTQDADGTITDTAPFKWGKRPADPVCASYLLLGWFLYQYYGDTRALAEHYDGFKAWVDYLGRRAEDHIVPYGSWGDWSPPASESVGSSALARDTPLPLMSTGYFYYCSSLVAQMAHVLGHTADEQRYTEQARAISSAFNRHYLNAKGDGFGANNQAANAFALFLGLVPEQNVSRVLASLERDVQQHDFHLTTGNLCTKYLLESLSQHGAGQTAFRIASQETYPSWGFMLRNGATALWERWELLTQGGMNSHDHPMMGSVSSWFYKYLAGIRLDPAAPAFRQFFVQPEFVDGLSWVRASYRTPYGVVRSEWRQEAGTRRLRVTVPVNTSAHVVLPLEPQSEVTESGRPAAPSRRDGGTGVFEVGSGDYEFVVH